VFAAMASLALYGMFVLTQTVRHRDFFLPVTSEGVVVEAEEHAVPPTGRAAAASLALLVMALAAVVGLAKVESPAIEAGVLAVGFPPSFVGVVIALLVLLPETLAAVRAAQRDRVQISLNLAFGSAMASNGLTIPVIAVASIWLEGPLLLGLGPTQMVLLALTITVAVLTVVPGRATRLQGGVHLVLLAAFLFLAISPWPRQAITLRTADRQAARTSGRERLVCLITELGAARLLGRVVADQSTGSTGQVPALAPNADGSGRRG
jgi:Ca2+:H+ antiporter